MDTPPIVGERLRLAREAAGLNQASAAQKLGLDRVNLSYWETGRRTPGLAQLERLADTYATTVDYLLGVSDDPALLNEHARLYAHLAPDEEQARGAIKRWLRFLDQWADVLEEAGEPLPRRGLPPVSLRRSDKPETDSRRAEGLAQKVREEYKLGQGAIPDLAAFLDDIGVLVVRAGLGAQSEISGVFYNHPRLGYCILVNAQQRPGRQVFTLAHEFAHALFHYQELGLVSRSGQRDRMEAFADTFAGHFLVTKNALEQATNMQQVSDPYEVVLLQQTFRVSYAMLLLRLYSAGLLGKSQFEQYRQHSPQALARRLSLPIEAWQSTENRPPELQAYPASVLERVIGFLYQGVLSVPAAASLLAVPQEVIATLLAQHEPASAEEASEFEQFPEPTPPRLRSTRKVG